MRTNSPETKKTARELRNDPVLSKEYTKNKIKFQNYYFKLGYQDRKPDPNTIVCKFANLIQVIRIKREELTESFIEYDTRFLGGNFQIPDSKELLLLIFLDAPFYKIFTTLRKCSKRKEKFYKDRVGQRFEILIGYE